MTTVGFGDVVPGTHIGKVIAGIDAFLGLCLFGFIVWLGTYSFQRNEIPAIRADPSLILRMRRQEGVPQGSEIEAGFAAAQKEGTVARLAEALEGAELWIRLR